MDADGCVADPSRVPLTNHVASAVVNGTAATSPMLPTSVRTISTATTSELATVPSD